MRCIARTLCMLALSAGGPGAHAGAAGLPLWEVGVAGGVGRVSDYPGAAQAHTRSIMLPMLIVRGPVWRIDADGVRGRLFASHDWEADLSATAAFNAKDNQARSGMADLDYLFGLGPQLVYKGWSDRPGRPTLHLKLRALMSTDGRRIDRRGTSFDPELRWQLVPPGPPHVDLTLWLQASWASAGLQRYFYEVGAVDVTPARGLHAARAGYLGTEAGLTWTQRPRPGWSWFATARARSLHGAANLASPLLESRRDFSLGIGFAWTPWRSRTLVTD